MTQVFLAITNRSTGAIEAFNLSNVSRIKQGASGNALVQYLIGDHAIVFETKESFDEVMTTMSEGSDSVVLATDEVMTATAMSEGEGQKK